MSPDQITARSDVAKDTINDSEKERPTSAESFSGVEADDDNVHDDTCNDMARHQSTSSAPVLTLSRARAIALVATVTGASFLNVSVFITPPTHT